MFMPISPSMMSTITAVMTHITRMSDFSLFCSFWSGIHFSRTYSRPLLSLCFSQAQHCGKSIRFCLRQPYGTSRFRKFRAEMGAWAENDEAISANDDAAARRQFRLRLRQPIARAAVEGEASSGSLTTAGLAAVRFDSRRSDTRSRPDRRLLRPRRKPSRCDQLCIAHGITTIGVAII
jgi:hypothetical protein